MEGEEGSHEIFFKAPAPLAFPFLLSYLKRAPKSREHRISWLEEPLGSTLQYRYIF